MENYENNEFRPEPEYTPPQQPQTPPQQEPVYHQPESQPYSGAGVGRKESPFADSPYVTNRQPEQNSYRSTYVPPVPPQQPPVKPKKVRNPRAGKIWKTILCTVLALAVVAGSCGVTAALVNNRWEKRTDEIVAQVEVQKIQMDELRQQIAAAANGHSVSGTPSNGEGLTPGQVYARNVQSVVLITCEVTGTNAFGQVSRGQSSGSGFILTENGYVVTNAHVVDGATVITVSTHDGQELEAQLVGSDTTNDVAVLKVEAEGLPAVTIGSSDDLIVGDQVVAIGNPLGELTSTMTVGYVSAKDRDVTTDGTTINMIQTDAAINSGNSGGSVLGIGLIIAFNRKPLVLVGTSAIMIISYVIRKLPYTVRSGTAFLYQMDPYVEEASINLGVSPLKTFFTVTARMMLPGVLSGAVLSWITCINELSSSIMLYSGKTSTIAIAIYQEVTHMNDGPASALATILTVTTIISLLVVFRLTKGKVKIV